MAFSCSLGAIEEQIRYLDITPLQGGVRGRWIPTAGYAQNFRIGVDGVGFASKFADENVISELTAPYPAGGTDHITTITPIGDWQLPIDIEPQFIAYTQQRPNRYHLDISAVPVFQSFKADGTPVTQLSNWNITGIRRWLNCKPHPHNKTWATLSLDMVTIGSVHTIVLSINGFEIAVGDITGNGTCTLNEKNSSGVSGFVDLTYTGAITSGLFVVDYPVSYKVYAKLGSPLIAGEFISGNLKATIIDNKRDNVFTYRSPIVAAGTWYIVAHQVNENGTESTGTTNVSILTKLVPDSVTNLQYTGGGYAAAIVSWTASTTALSTYNIFDSGDTGFLDIDSATSTHIAGTGTLTQTLPAISGSFLGKRYVVVRSVLAGVDDGTVKILTIDYSSGSATGEPPPPLLQAGRVSIVGRTLSVSCSVDSTRSLTVPVNLQMFLYPAGTSPNYAIPTTTLALGNKIGASWFKTISATAVSDGDFEAVIRTIAASGAQSLNTNEIGVFNLTLVAPPDSLMTIRSGL